MGIRLCMRCMREYAPGETVCPRCGTPHGARVRTPYVLNAGTILNGKYVVGLPMGQGGFGITYVGYDLLLGQKVAIKEYYPMETGSVTRNNMVSAYVSWNRTGGRADPRTGYEQFLKEARKMAALDAIPGIVGVRDLFEENNTSYIVMDFIEGETLKSYLTHNGPMSYEQALTILGPVIKAMELVHNAGMIHRDISPDNIMLSTDGTVWLLDLGAAREIERPAGNAPSMLVTKKGFSPMEQYANSGTVGTWTDVYAMSATLYYAVTGTVPPLAADRLYNDTLQCRPRLNEAQFRVIAEGMSMDPNTRIPTMAMLWERLCNPGRQIPSVPHPTPAPTPAPALAPAPQRPVRKMGVLGWSLCVLLLAAVTAVSVWYGKGHCWFGHEWMDATCEQPVTCANCRQTEGEALGHRYSTADCTHASICSVCGDQQRAALGHDLSGATCTEAPVCARCGVEEGTALGHSWKDATNSAPKTCTRCGATEGHAKGYHASLSGSFSKVSVSVGTTNLHPYILDSPVNNCRQFSVRYQITNVDYGNPFGEHTIYIKNLSGKWVSVGTFNVSNDSKVNATFKFSTPISFTQLAITAARNVGNSSYSTTVGYYDFYLNE